MATSVLGILRGISGRNAALLTIGILPSWGGIDVNGITSDEPSLQRTGTAPFMTCELLVRSESVRRLYRHEVEFFLWVPVYICIRRSQPKEDKSWREGSYIQIVNAKTGFLNSPADDHWTMQVGEAYKAHGKQAALFFNCSDQLTLVPVPDVNLLGRGWMMSCSTTSS